MRKKNRKSLAPSTCAASRISSGRLDSKNALAMTTFQTATAPGRIMAPTVSRRPRSPTTRYLGMMPPSKKSVTTRRKVIVFRPGRSLREST
jgi:hypothetical protein